MKNLEQGKTTLATLEVECKKCQAKLEIEARDLTFSNNDDSLTPVYYYICPCCSRTQLLSYDELSEEIIFDLIHK